MSTKVERAARALLSKWDAHPYTPWREVGFISGDVAALREALAEQAELCPLCGDGKLYEHTMYRCKGCGSELADARLMDKNKALAEQAEQEPVAYDLTTREGCVALAIEKGFERRKLHNSDVEYFVCNSTILHSFVCEALAAPVRTKDLTDREKFLLIEAYETQKYKWTAMDFIDAVIAADREKNK